MQLCFVAVCCYVRLSWRGRGRKEGSNICGCSQEGLSYLQGMTSFAVCLYFSKDQNSCVAEEQLRLPAARCHVSLLHL